ncbi:hypothetical protein Zmor_002881 [Zophobas morio]|uniref:Uncharacterized protein n=1 Tax=Zophobas morio TaxID=2755281 RepID=A0AA38HLD5_9CUCU|nr:hypothetical protein Zmor_002881 [Zophobas morio]
MGFHVIAGAHCVKCIKPKTCSVYGDFWELGYGRILQGNFGILGSKMGRSNKPLFNRNDIFVFWKSSHQKNASVASNKRDGLQVLQLELPRRFPLIERNSGAPQEGFGFLRKKMVGLF